jgi:periplasmic copper chaperone A
MSNTRLAWTLLSLVAVGAAVAGDLRVLSAHAAATAAGAGNAAAYLTVHNVGAAGDRLLRASTPVAASVEFHHSQLDGTIVRMRALPYIDVPVGGSVEMRTGGTHLMLLGLKRPLRAGEQFALHLEFAQAGPVDATVRVLPIGAAVR